MIQQETRLKVADNSGATEILCIRVLGGSGRKYGSVGDIIIAAVKQAQPNAGVKKGDVVRAVDRANGAGVRPPGWQPHQIRRQRGGADQRRRATRGTRIFGPVGRELREKQFMRIVSLAPEVL